MKLGNPSTLILAKNMPEFSYDENLYRVEFFLEGKFIITCAESKKCVVAGFSDNNSPNRVIDVGFEVIGDVFLMTTKFFGVIHPQKKIIAFYELDEI